MAKIDSLTEPIRINENDKSSSLYVEQENIFIKIAKASIPSACSFLLELAPNTITIFFLGISGKDNLIDGFGLGMMWSYCFGIGFLNGVACGLETMVSQAFGADNFTLCGKLFNRSLSIMTAMMLPVSILLVNTDKILSLFNDNQQLTEDSGKFATSLIGGVYLNGIHVALNCFLNGQNIYNYQVIAQFIATVSHILWCFVFINYLDLGLVGCGLASTCSEFIGLIILIGIIKFTHCSDQVFVRYDLTYFTNWWPFLKVAIPIGSLLWLEWLCYDTFQIQAAYLIKPQFEANVIMNNFAMFYYQFSFGISIATTTYVGNEMGKQNINMAKKFALRSLLVCIIFLSVTQLLIFLFRKYFVRIYTNDTDIQDQLLNSLFYLQILTTIDGIQAVFTGILRAIGKERMGAISFMFFYLVVGETLCYFFIFKLNLELNGVLIAMIIGAFGYIIFNLLNMLLSDWNDLVKDIKEKMEEQEQQQLLEQQDLE